MRPHNLFNDKRLALEYDSLSASMSVNGTAVINRACSEEKERKAAYRFINNEKVTVDEIAKHMKSQTLSNIMQTGTTDVLIIQDTMEVVRENVLRRLNKSGKTVLETVRKKKGMRSHSGLAMNADTGMPLGFVSLKIWGREPGDGREHDPQDNRKRQPHYYVTDPDTGKTRYKYSIPVMERDSESRRWLEVAKDAREAIPEEIHLTMVQDREGDMYPLLTLPQQLPNFDIVVRAAKKRIVLTPSGDEELSEYTMRQPVAHTYKITVHKGKGVKKREATVDLRYGMVEIRRPHSPVYPQKSVKLYFVRVTEQPKAGVAKGEMIDWLLLTSLEVKSVEAAVKVVSYYKKRWFIEDFHRLLKKKGYGIEDIQVESPHAFEINLALAIRSAYQVAVLKKGFDSSDKDDPATLVFTPLEIRIVTELNRKFNPEKKIHKNPFPKGSLAWASWVVACEGGWSAKPSQPKPGIITFKRGLDRIEDVYSFLSLDYGTFVGKA